MKLVSKSFLLTLAQDVTIGELEMTLVAQVMGDKKGFDIEHLDNMNVTYMGIPIDGYQNWRKFRDFHKEMGIDFDKAISAEFEKIFDVPNVKLFIDHLEF
jgi:hypothetical protein